VDQITPESPEEPFSSHLTWWHVRT